MENLELSIKNILERNQKVEADKAWETSFIRKAFLSLLTYIFAYLWLWMIHEPLVWLKAMVPVLGFIISTLTLPPLKNWWVKKYNR